MSAGKRRICYVSGTRADFGLMQATLARIQAHAALELSIVVTGMHLSTLHGNTADDIVAAGLPVSAKVPVDVSDSTGAAMARNIGKMLAGFVDEFERLKPEVVLLLGDRGEMLAAALAAIHLNIHVAHIHGGERSGTVDEPVRHAISKLSHLHFVATDEARERLVRMGERAENVFVTGAPGLDGLHELAGLSKATLCSELGFDPQQRIGLFMFHPVLQEAAQAGSHARILLQAMLDEGMQVVALMPNSDAGSEAVRGALEQFRDHARVRLLTHLPRARFVSWMANCDIMVGNSSSGIIEAATFGTPVINIGIRQNLRQRNLNVTDTMPEQPSVHAALADALQKGRYAPMNCYGDGHAGERITDYLATLPLTDAILLKCNTY
ncbi:UDP-N-acetylglucosamine 2-epimerase [Janthinobacterium sp. 17J80-10]|uniref:UDP-N-acetylglucosamine 2-epimerase n=1 Tax=Janthinobacterium sp. 17J80-10 TaxID=2497863 RepID=UPI00100545E0|nr:UDP-N-acetylglucosamine 2-epimerase [Janthinobacterium sp. 17J80-10]QAU33074.1 UDP-N-acetylglucosamine 2-epimerase (hydrolyzing) [Janthinobacterium sp. 17J80-10]